MIRGWFSLPSVTLSKLDDFVLQVRFAQVGFLLTIAFFEADLQFQIRQQALKIVSLRKQSESDQASLLTLLDLSEG